MSEFEAFRQHTRQAGLDDFPLRGFEIVLYASLFDHVLFKVVDAVGRSPIAIARLADAADVYEVSLGRIDDQLINLHSLDPTLANKCAGHVGMAEKTDWRFLAVEAAGGIETVKNVVPFVGRIEGRMHDGESMDALLHRQLAKP